MDETHWLHTDSKTSISQRVAMFWQRMSSELRADTFWSDRIKALRDSPVDRLGLAVSHLPLPGAFRECLVALRAMIREKRKHKSEYHRELRLLYWLAAIDSFWERYSHRCQCSGYSVFERIPGNVIRDLNTEYDQVGYRKLELLKKTDIKWLVEAWGEPGKHSTVNALERDVWRRWEEDFFCRKREELNAHLETPIEPDSNDGFFHATNTLSVQSDQLEVATHPCSQCGHRYRLLADHCPKCGINRKIEVLKGEQKRLPAESDILGSRKVVATSSIAVWTMWFLAIIAVVAVGALSLILRAAND